MPPSGGSPLLWTWLLHALYCSGPARTSPGPSSPAGRCSPSEYLSTQTQRCSPCGKHEVKSPEGLRCICAAGLTGTGQAHPAGDCKACSPRQTASLWESAFLDSSFLACNSSCNLTACQLLANTVILNAFSLETRAFDLYTKAKGQNLPELFYRRPETPPGRAVLQFLSWKGSKQISLKVVKYDVRGHFLGWEDVKGGTLQLCTDSQRVLDAAFSFGTSYHQSCRVQVSDLLRRVPEPTLYELFLEFPDDQGKPWLWPVPVVNPRLRLSDHAGLNSQPLRRFFLVDGLSGRTGNLANPPASVTLAVDLLLSIYLPTSSPGDQPPFLLTVKYARQESTAITQVSFAVAYSQIPEASQQVTVIALAVLGSLAALYALLKTSSWVRRSRLQNIGLVVIIKFFAFFAGSLANAFFGVTLGIGIYWLIAFKGQQFSAVGVTLPPAGSQLETSFIIYLSCAFGLKALDLLHLLITQLTTSISLIDWERPREKPALRAAPGGRRVASSVSIWRTFLVANEWNEIQTHRKLNPLLQLVAVLLLLEVVGLKHLASHDLTVNLHPGPDSYVAAWSPILRFGISASLWMAVAIVQMVFSIGVYERFVEDKIHQFVDLCSLSNVSIFILMHRCYGFYIHGRSVHGPADVGMDAMYACLRREEEDLCPLRGLEPNSEIQTFEVFLTDRVRQLYDKITQPFMEVPGGKRCRPDVHEQRLKSYYTLNRFLSSFLEHAYRDMDYVVKDKFFLERVLDMEFQELGDMSVLYNDDRALFSRTLFYNNELALLLFDTLLFSVVDLGAQDFVLAAISTFLVQKVVEMVRNALGRRNLAAKTLVEKRFLI